MACPCSLALPPNTAYQRRGAAAPAACACSPGGSRADGRQTKHAGPSGCCLEVSPPQRFTDGVELASILERKIRRPTIVLLEELNVDLCCVRALTARTWYDAWRSSSWFRFAFSGASPKLRGQIEPRPGDPDVREVRARGQLLQEGLERSAAGGIVGRDRARRQQRGELLGPVERRQQEIVVRVERPPLPSHPRERRREKLAGARRLRRLASRHPVRHRRIEGRRELAIVAER